MSTAFSVNFSKSPQKSHVAKISVIIKPPVVVMQLPKTAKKREKRRKNKGCRVFFFKGYEQEKSLIVTSVRETEENLKKADCF